MNAAVRHNVGHLKTGCRYQVAREFKDRDGVIHPVGERWTFRGADVLPYEDGYSFYVSTDGEDERRFLMQDRPDAQATFFKNAATYVCSVRPEPPSVSTLAPPSVPPLPYPMPSGGLSRANVPSATAGQPRPGRFSLHALVEQRKVARARYKAAVRHLPRNPPLWFGGLGVLLGAELIREGLHARAHGEPVNFGLYGDYPWWFVMSFGVIAVAMYTTQLVLTLIKRTRRRPTAPRG